eukprot:SAG31_NODE_7570_length_1651_cov_1.224227_2_plen_303_part_00
MIIIGEPECGFVMGEPVREGCSRAERAGYYLECCVAEETASTSDCVNEIDWKVDATSHCPASNAPENSCQAMENGGHMTAAAEICEDTGTACEFFEQTRGQTCTEICGAAGLVCLDGWDDDPNTPGNCDHHLIAGVQTGGAIDQTDVSVAGGQVHDGMHDFGVGGCLNPYGNQICKCGSSQCEVDTAYPFSWVDISNTGTLITDWAMNADDGYFRVELPFDFSWFGESTRTVLVGTNGFLTLGDSAAPSHQSTLPIPCAETGCGEGDRTLAVGLLAVFWYATFGDFPARPEFLIWRCICCLV